MKSILIIVLLFVISGFKINADYDSNKNVETMDSKVYTHAMWRVKPGKQQEFIGAWDAMAQVFKKSALAPVERGC